MRILHFTALVFVLGLPAALAAKKGPSAAEQMRALEKKLGVATSDKRCSEPQDCLIMGYGQRPCGGPSRYIVYSKHANEAKIEDLGGQYTKAERRANKESNAVGTCVMLELPTPTCERGECAAVANANDPQ